MFDYYHPNYNRHNNDNNRYHPYRRPLIDSHRPNYPNQSNQPHSDTNTNKPQPDLALSFRPHALSILPSLPSLPNATKTSKLCKQTNKPGSNQANPDYWGSNQLQVDRFFEFFLRHGVRVVCV